MCIGCQQMKKLWPVLIVRMLPFALLLMVLPHLRDAAQSWQPPRYAAYAPFTSFRSRFTTHQATHPIIRTKIVVIDENAKKEHPGDSSHEAYHEDSEYQSKDESHATQNELHPGMRRYPKVRHSLRIRLGARIPEYSVPIELSSWRPLLGPSIGYPPLSHFGERGVHTAVEGFEPDPDPHLILPIGIPRLHNPQIRPPRQHRSHGYGEDLGVHYDEIGEEAALTDAAFLKAKNAMKKLQMLRKLVNYK